MRTRHLPDTVAAHFVVLVPGHVYAEVIKKYLNIK